VAARPRLRPARGGRRAPERRRPPPRRQCPPSPRPPGGPMTTTHLAPAPLDREAMRDMAARVVADRRWDGLPHDAGRRVYERLGADGRVEVWAIAWRPGHDTGFHDHDESAGAFCVAEGALVEERLTLGGTGLRREIGPGDTVEFGPSHVHRVRNAG